MGLRELLYLVLAFLRPQNILADWEANDKNLTWVFDVRNAITSQNQTYKLNPDTGAYRYHFDIHLVNSYKFESQSNDAVTMGCYGWKDDSDRWHTMNYVADSHGWRVIRNIAEPIRVYPTFDHHTMRSFLDFLPQCLAFDVKSAPLSFGVLTNRQPTSPPLHSDHHDSHVSHGTENVHHIAPASLHSRKGSQVNTDFGVSPIGTKSKLGGQLGNTKLESISNFNKPQRTTTSLHPNDYGDTTSSRAKGGSRGSRPEARFGAPRPTFGSSGFKPEGPSSNSPTSSKYSDSKKVVELSSTRRNDGSSVQRPKDVAPQVSLGSLRSEDGSRRSTLRGSQPPRPEGSKSEGSFHTSEGGSIDLKPKSVFRGSFGSRSDVSSKGPEPKVVTPGSQVYGGSIPKGGSIGSRPIGSSLDDHPEVAFSGGSRGSKYNLRNPISESDAVDSKADRDSTGARQETAEPGLRLKGGSQRSRAQIDFQGSKPTSKSFHLNAFEKIEGDFPASKPKGDTKAVQSKEDFAKQRTQTGLTGLTDSRPGQISLSPKQESNLKNSRPNAGGRGLQSTAISPFEVSRGSTAESDFPRSKQEDLSPISRPEHFAPDTRPIGGSPRLRPGLETSSFTKPQTEGSSPGSKPTEGIQNLRPEERFKESREEGDSESLRPKIGGRDSKAIDIRPSSGPEHFSTGISPSSVFLGTRKDSGFSPSKSEDIAPRTQLIGGTPGLVKSSPPTSISRNRDLDLRPRGPSTNTRSGDTSIMSDSLGPIARDHSEGLVSEVATPSPRPKVESRFSLQVENGSPSPRPKVESLSGTKQKDRTPSSPAQESDIQRSNQRTGAPAKKLNDGSIEFSTRAGFPNIVSKSEGGSPILEVGSGSFNLSPEGGAPSISPKVSVSVSQGSRKEGGHEVPKSSIGSPTSRQKGVSFTSRSDGGVNSFPTTTSSPGIRPAENYFGSQKDDGLENSTPFGLQSSMLPGLEPKGHSQGSLQKGYEVSSRTPASRQGSNVPISNRRGGAEGLRQTGDSLVLKSDGGSIELNTGGGFPSSKTKYGTSSVVKGNVPLDLPTEVGVEERRSGSGSAGPKPLGTYPESDSKGSKPKGGVAGPTSDHLPGFSAKDNSQKSEPRKGSTKSNFESGAPESIREIDTPGARLAGSGPDFGTRGFKQGNKLNQVDARINDGFSGVKSNDDGDGLKPGLEQKRFFSHLTPESGAPGFNAEGGKGIQDTPHVGGARGSQRFSGSLQGVSSPDSRPNIGAPRSEYESDSTGPRRTGKTEFISVALPSTRPDVGSRGFKQGVKSGNDGLKPGLGQKSVFSQLTPGSGAPGSNAEGGKGIQDTPHVGGTPGSQRFSGPLQGVSSPDSRPISGAPRSEYISGSAGPRRTGKTEFISAALPSSQPDVGSRGFKQGVKSDNDGLKPGLGQKSVFSQVTPERGAPGSNGEGGKGIQDTPYFGGTPGSQRLPGPLQGVSSPDSRPNIGAPRSEYESDSTGPRRTGTTDAISSRPALGSRGFKQSNRLSPDNGTSGVRINIDFSGVKSDNDGVKPGLGQKSVFSQVTPERGAPGSNGEGGKGIQDTPYFGGTPGSQRLPGPLQGVSSPDSRPNIGAPRSEYESDSTGPRRTGTTDAISSRPALGSRGFKQGVKSDNDGLKPGLGQKSVFSQVTPESGAPGSNAEGGKGIQDTPHFGSTPESQHFSDPLQGVSSPDSRPNIGAPRSEYESDSTGPRRTGTTDVVSSRPEFGSRGLKNGVKSDSDGLKPGLGQKSVFSQLTPESGAPGSNAEGGEGIQDTPHVGGTPGSQRFSGPLQGVSSPDSRPISGAPRSEYISGSAGPRRTDKTEFISAALPSSQPDVGSRGLKQGNRLSPDDETSGARINIDFSGVKSDNDGLKPGLGQKSVFSHLTPESGALGSRAEGGIGSQKPISSIEDTLHEGGTPGPQPGHSFESRSKERFSGQQQGVSSPDSRPITGAPRSEYTSGSTGPGRTGKTEFISAALPSSQPDVGSRGFKQGVKSDNDGLKPGLGQKSVFSQLTPESGAPGFNAEGGKGSLKPINSIHDTLHENGKPGPQPGHSFESRSKERFSGQQQGVSSPDSRPISGAPRSEYISGSAGPRRTGKTEFISATLPSSQPDVGSRGLKQGVKSDNDGLKPGLGQKSVFSQLTPESGAPGSNGEGGKGIQDTPHFGGTPGSQHFSGPLQGVSSPDSRPNIGAPRSEYESDSTGPRRTGTTDVVSSRPEFGSRGLKNGVKSDNDGLKPGLDQKRVFSQLTPGSEAPGFNAEGGKGSLKPINSIHDTLHENGKPEPQPDHSFESRSKERFSGQQQGVSSPDSRPISGAPRSEYESDSTGRRRTGNTEIISTSSPVLPAVTSQYDSPGTEASPGAGPTRLATSPKVKGTLKSFESSSRLATGEQQGLTPQTPSSHGYDYTPPAQPKQYSPTGHDFNQTPKFEIPPGSSPITTYIPPPATNLKHFTTEIPHYLQPPPGDAQYCTCTCPRF